MASLGEHLQREREMRGVSLEEISAATKISVRFLHALETEDFAKLPGGIFTRGFIRAYAKYLGLDEESVLAEYQLAAHPRSEPDLSRLVASRRVPSRKGSRGLLIALLLAVVMIAGGYLLYRYARRAPQLTGRAAAPAATPEPAQAAAPQTEQPTPAVTGGGSTPSPAEYVPEAGDGLVLQIAATERSWVAVDADGKTVLQRVLSPNEIQTLKAKESFDITTGNAQGIILTLNGETLKPLGRRGEVKSVHLTRNDLKKISP
jgi:cytoskeleton protein RodZ